MQFQEVIACGPTGAILVSPTVEVFNAGTNVHPAQIYDVAGANLANPFTGSSQGVCGFQAPNGLYDIAISQGATTLPKIQNVAFLDLAALTTAQLTSIFNQMKAAGLFAGFLGV